MYLALILATVRWAPGEMGYASRMDRAGRYSAERAAELASPRRSVGLWFLMASPKECLSTSRASRPGNCARRSSRRLASRPHQLPLHRITRPNHRRRSQPANHPQRLFKPRHHK